MNLTALIQGHAPVCVCLAAFTDDSDTAMKMSESIAQESGAAAFVTYWKDREGGSELKVAAACDGVSTLATVGRLADRRFTPGKPVRHLPGRLGDAAKEVLDSAAADLPGLPDMPEYGGLTEEGLKDLLAGHFQTVAHDALESP